MNPLEYLAILLYVLSVVKCFSFGVYGLKQGRGGTFALCLVLIAVSGALFYRYVVTSV